MLDRALLALADERGSGQDYGEHGEIVDDLHHRGEPARFQVRVELCAGHDLDRRTHQPLASADELRDVVDDDALDVGHAIEGLGHGSGIYVDLNRRLPPRENVLLKLWGNFNYEDKTLRIHRCIDLCRGDLHCRLECRWSEAVRNSARQVGMVFVDDSN